MTSYWIPCLFFKKIENSGFRERWVLSRYFNTYKLWHYWKQWAWARRIYWCNSYVGINYNLYCLINKLKQAAVGNCIFIMFCGCRFRLSPFYGQYYSQFSWWKPFHFNTHCTSITERVWRLKVTYFFNIMNRISHSNIHFHCVEWIWPLVKDEMA